MLTVRQKMVVRSSNINCPTPSQQKETVPSKSHRIAFIDYSLMYIVGPSLRQICEFGVFMSLLWACFLSSKGRYRSPATAPIPSGIQWQHPHPNGLHDSLRAGSRNKRNTKWRARMSKTTYGKIGNLRRLQHMWLSLFLSKRNHCEDFPFFSFRETIVPAPLIGEREEWMKHYGPRVQGRLLLPDDIETLRWNWLIVLLIIYYAISGQVPDHLLRSWSFTSSNRFQFLWTMRFLKFNPRSYWFVKFMKMCFPTKDVFTRWTLGNGC
jgi:hypothetical protein